MTTASKYAHTDKLFSDGSVSWYDAFYLSLITDAYVFSSAHTAWAEVSPYEVATGAGYTTGGKLLTGISVANNGLFAADVDWAALTKTFKQGVLRVNKVVGGTIDPLIGCIIFHPAGDNIEADNELFAVRWPNGRVVRFGS